MAKKRKADYKTRDPHVTSRDPVMAPAPRKPRRYIPASAPTVCPDCGGNTRQASGRRPYPVRKTILEYRTCAHCGMKLAAERPMTAVEATRFCDGWEDAIAEYEADRG